MDKVILPKEIAEAVQIKFDYYNGEGTAYVMWECSASDSIISKWIDAEKINIIKLSQALVNGYEVEETPEDKVRDKFITLNKSMSSQDMAVADGIIWTLNELKISIEGVNT